MPAMRRAGGWGARGGFISLFRRLPFRASGFLLAAALAGAGDPAGPGAAPPPNPPVPAPAPGLKALLDRRQTGRDALTKADRLVEAWRYLKDESSRKEAEGFFRKAVESHESLLRDVRAYLLAFESGKRRRRTMQDLGDESAAKVLDWNVRFELAQMHILWGRLSPDDNPDPNLGNEKIERGNRGLDELQGDLASSLHESVEQALEFFPPTFELLKAYVMWQRGMRADALRLFDEAISALGREPMMHSSLVRAYFDKMEFLSGRAPDDKAYLKEAFRTVDALLSCLSDPKAISLRKRAELLKAKLLLIRGENQEALKIALPGVRDSESGIRQALSREIVREAAKALPPSERPVEVLREIAQAVSKSSVSGDEDAIPGLVLGEISPDAFYRRAEPSWSSRRLSRKGNGVSDQAVAAVEAGLKWLAERQEPDGHWDCGKHGGQALPSQDAMLTGLAVLAFLGAGYTDNAPPEASPLQKKYEPTVQRALDWLQSRQGADGSFSIDDYAHGICTNAVAEAHFMMGGRKETAQRAVDHVVRRQKPSGGWDFGDSGDPSRDRGNTSVTCWQVMALKLARIANLRVPQSSFDGILKYFKSAADVSNSEATGEVAREIVDGKPSQGGPSETAMVMLSCLFLDFRPDNRFLIAGAGLLNKQAPQVGETVDLSYTYFGSMAMFQMGKEAFAPWNARMRDPLIALQLKAPGELAGSWPPEKDKRGKEGGRVYTTAMAILCLEVYYRYLPVYGTP